MPTETGEDGSFQPIHLRYGGKCLGMSSHHLTGPFPLDIAQKHQQPLTSLWQRPFYTAPEVCIRHVLRLAAQVLCATCRRHIVLAVAGLPDGIQDGTIEATTQIGEDARQRRKGLLGCVGACLGLTKVPQGCRHVVLWRLLLKRHAGTRVQEQPVDQHASPLLIQLLPGALIALLDGAPREFQCSGLIGWHPLE